MIQTTNLDLFGGIPVRDYAVSLKWYEQFFGSPPAFFPDDLEAVWELAEHRYVYIVQKPERAGHAIHLFFVNELDSIIEGVAKRGLEPAKQEAYENGVRKITYNDPDGNEISFGGGSG